MVRVLIRAAEQMTSERTDFFHTVGALSKKKKDVLEKPDLLQGLTTNENHRLAQIYKEEELHGGLTGEIRLRALGRLLGEMIEAESWKHIKLIETEISGLEEDLKSRDDGTETNGNATSIHVNNGEKPPILNAASVIDIATNRFRHPSLLNSKESIQLIHDLNQFPNELDARDALWKLIEVGIKGNILSSDDREAVQAVDDALDILGCRYLYDGEMACDVAGRVIAANKIAVMCLEKDFVFDDVYRFDSLAFDLSKYDKQMENSLLLLSLANTPPLYEIRTSTVGSFISRIEREGIDLSSEEVVMALLNLTSSKLMNHDSNADRLSDTNLRKAINIFCEQKYAAPALSLLFTARKCCYELPIFLMQKAYDVSNDKTGRKRVQEKPLEFGNNKFRLGKILSRLSNPLQE